MARTVMRYVEHTIHHVPEGGIVFEAFCMAVGCDATSGGQEEQEAALDWALRHTGRTGHDLFRREYTDQARVIRHE